MGGNEYFWWVFDWFSKETTSPRHIMRSFKKPKLGSDEKIQPVPAPEKNKEWFPLILNPRRGECWGENVKLQTFWQTTCLIDSHLFLYI